MGLIGKISGTMAILSVVIAAAGGEASAGTATTSFTVQTNTIAVCKITTAAATMDFGNYDPTATADNDNGLGSFGFKCTKGTAYKVYIAGGRTMAAGSESLSFEMYSDPGRSIIFPDTNAAGISGSASSNGIEIITNIYGRIPAGQDVTAGKTFTQTLTATVDY